jgi:hypothetical protein
VTDEELTLREVAIKLGTSEGAIRKRVARSTLRSEFGANGKRYVYLNGGGDEGADASSTRESEALRSERAALIECQ